MIARAVTRPTGDEQDFFISRFSDKDADQQQAEDLGETLNDDKKKGDAVRRPGWSLFQMFQADVAELDRHRRTGMQLQSHNALAHRFLTFINRLGH